MFRGPTDPTAYSGQRKADAIVSYMVKQSLPAVSILADAAKHDEFAKSDNVVLVAYVDTFDLVLVAEQQTGLVQAGRQLEPARGGRGAPALGRLLRRPFARFSPQAVVRYLMWLPLNMIPVIGTVLFILAQGRFAPAPAAVRG